MVYSVRFISIFLLTASLAHAQRIPEDVPRPMSSLKKVPVPGPSEEHIKAFVKNKKALVQLGKALFWDTRVGSDNKTACASCHFHAGADSRIINQVNPGSDNIFQFSKPNSRLLSTSFPIPFNRFKHYDDVVSSQGVFNSNFLWSSDGDEYCDDEADDIFHGLSSESKAVNTRRVEGRNTPTVINAAFNFRNFWDGRANNVFNGADPFGNRNKETFLWKVENGSLIKAKVSIPTSALASQASGPPLSGFEMSCKQRLFLDIGRKLLKRPILENQKISVRDSVLGEYKKRRPQYIDLVKKAFRNEWWDTNRLVRFTSLDASRIGSMDLVDPPMFHRREIDVHIPLSQNNFSLFFGLALQSYMQTLIADDTPLDRYLDGELSALNAQQVRGKKVFETKGRCINCHSGAELTNASVTNVSSQRIETMIISDDFIASYDNGFYNIGVTPTNVDLGVGGKDPFGNPLSETLMVKLGMGDLLGNDFKPESVQNIGRVAVNGAFKTPGLRNIELTGPYFHNGGKSTLMQVVEFYNRGGDFGRQNQDDLDPDIRRLHLSDQEKDDLVAFLLALTDERVRFKKAPFDHPSICFTNGHDDIDGNVIPERFTIRGKDKIKCIDAVGRYGVVNESDALQPFLDVDHYRGEEFKAIKVVVEQ